MRLVSIELKKKESLHNNKLIATKQQNHSTKQKEKALLTREEYEKSNCAHIYKLIINLWTPPFKRNTVKTICNNNSDVINLYTKTSTGDRVKNVKQ